MNTAIEAESTPERLLATLVNALNEYKFFIDVNIIFDSPNSFLYRQKGQLKLDSSIVEEFLPWLVNPVLMPEIEGMDVKVGPVKAYAAVYFESTLAIPAAGGGPNIRTKDQDFTLYKELYIRTSHTGDFHAQGQYAEKVANLAYVAAECKTNLDKTMFQEACATAHDLKSAVPGAKYYLLCDWLDMTPVSTAPTDIDEILILRKAKRITSNRRASYNTYKGRQAGRAWYVDYLQRHPYSVDVIGRFVSHIRSLLVDDTPGETEVLTLGYF